MLLIQVIFSALLAVVTSLNLSPTNVNSVTETPSARCVTKANEDGYCVVYYLCNDNGTINTDGEGIIDVRGGPSDCPSYLDTCCRLTDVRDSNDPITPKPKPNSIECGYRNPNGAGLMSYGDETGNFAKFGEFPWMVAILKVTPLDEKDPDSPKMNLYVGGGSLIHPQVVLTVAHKVDAQGQMYRARIGEWDTQTTKEIYPYQDRDIHQVVIHEDYSRRNLQNDIALLILSSPIEKAPHIGFVCLPPPTYETPPGTRCFASGWGKDQFGKQGKYQVILKKVDVPVVDRNTCEKKLRTTRLGRFFKLHPTFMCAGGEANKDTCRGDGGSPLSCPIPDQENRYIQSGIVAWGLGCGENELPGAYVNIAALRDWIDQQMLSYGFGVATYNI